MKKHLLWIMIAIIGASSLAVIALNREESINASWIIVASLCIYVVAYRYYSRFIAHKVFQLDPNRPTPAITYNDGKDFVPTSKWVLYGHHFAAIAGAGPLVGPVMAAQMGYLPGTLWIVVGAVFAGAVQDFIILIASMRRKGRSLGEIARQEIGPVSGFVAMLAIIGVMVIILAALSLVVVHALQGSPWGTFTLAMTIPIAMLMGVYMRYIRPGAVLEATFIGITLLVLSIIVGKGIETSAWGELFTLEGTTLTWCLIVYGFAASVMPVWLLLAPRDYLSTFLKIGTILALALGIIFTLPNLNMPAVTQFVDGGGPVFSGKMFPFLFINIACGAISGFHSLVSSGTTPKMISSESHAPLIGYGAMLTESFVAIIALIVTTMLTPGVYFAMNKLGVAGGDVALVAQKVASFGFTVTPDELTALAREVGENTIVAKGAAPIFAVGLAQVFSNITGGLKDFWYHFAILFEAVFILTTIDAGTRVGRFILQDLMGHLHPKLGKTNYYPANILASGLMIAGWGYFLYQGVIDPEGGFKALWPLFGIANQMLAVVALVVGTTIILKHSKKVYSFITLVPLVWLISLTMTAGWQKIFDPTVDSFLITAQKHSQAISDGELIAPAKTFGEMQQVATNNYVDAILTGCFMICVVVIIISALRVWYKIMKGKKDVSLA